MSGKYGEPFAVSPVSHAGGSIIIDDVHRMPVIWMSHKSGSEFARVVVDRINACAEFDDPAAEIAALRSQAEIWANESHENAEFYREQKAEADKLREEVERLREVAKPFAIFAEKFDAKPIRGISDDVYGIHAGTEWEASISLSACRAARAALEPKS